MPILILFLGMLLATDAFASSCPFLIEKSALTTLQEQANDLELKVFENKSSAACQRRLDELKARMSKVDQLETRINTTVSLTKETTTDIDTTELRDTLKASSSAANSLSTLLSSNCDLTNSHTDVLTIADRLASTLEAGATIMAWRDPSSAVVGAVTAISVRLLVTVGQWFSSRNHNLSVAESNLDDRRYLDSLCFFRNLTVRYDQLRSMPQDNTNLRKLISLKEEELNRLSCDKAQNSGDKTIEELLGFAGKVQEHLKDKNNFESICAAAVDQLTDARLEISLRPLLTKADCLNTPKSYQVRLFCEKNRQLSDFSQSPNCEDEEKARAFLKNAQTFAELLPTVRKLLNGEEPKNLVEHRTKIKDELADLHLQLKLYDQMANEPATMRQLTTRSMENLGNGLLGKKFETYAEKSLDRADDANDIAAREVKLADEWVQKNRGTKAQLCQQITRAQYNTTSANDAVQSVVLICRALAYGGNPPLKSNDISYDSLSRDKSGKNITTRCDKMAKDVSKQIERNKEFSAQLRSLRILSGCR